ncbi:MULTISPECIES: FkbM family methyltransferase [Methylomonas]|uniref:FkbM family methyltransferase n=1 Tax=Methylomonas TaxID=416 RepID=UPI0012325E1F|nr:FkbM family methyltransferase [Methylomonas rhizoryzae]
MPGIDATVVKFLYRGWKARYRDHKAEILALTSALQPGDIAVDVGANKGSFIPSLAKAVAAGKLIAFEPQPYLADYLKGIVAAAGLSNVQVEAQGVSDRSGSLRLGIPGYGASSPGASFEEAVMTRESCTLLDVPVCTLDGYFATESRRIGAIKIDVEGHELAVLRGAESIMSHHRPLIVCECENRHLTEYGVEEVLGYFRSFGYDGYFVQRGRLRPVAEFNSNQHQRAEGEDYWNRKDYCNNFVMQYVGR